MRKKFWAVLIFTCMSVFVLGTVSVSAGTYGRLEYEVKNGEVTITHADDYGVTED